MSAATGYEGDVKLAEALATPYVDRLIDERIQLSTKIESLKVFMTTNPTYKALNYRHQSLLEDQLLSMSSYESTLVQRLTLLNTENQ